MSTEYKFASLNRRLIAAMIDLILLIVIITPINNLISYLFLNGQTLLELFNSYVSSHKTIDVNRLVDFLNENDAIYMYIFSQLLALLLASIYCISFWVWKGATPGKMLLRMKVVNTEGNNALSLKQAIIRLLGYFLSAATLGIGFIMINFRKDHKGLHDIMAHTGVVIDI